MWPPTLERQIHSRMELLDYLARETLLRERREQDTTDRDGMDQQRAEALAALHD